MTTVNSKPSSTKTPAPSPAYLRFGKRYRPGRVEDRYDAIVIGSGPGGLTTAVCLAKMGWKVAVFEAHYTAGGFTHAYGRHGYEWDVGVHYIGDVGYQRSMPYKLFQFLSNGQLQWADMGEIYDTVFLGDNYQFAFPKGEKALKAALAKDFPDETKAINKYFQLIRRISKSMPVYAMSKILPNATEPFIKAWQKHKLPTEMLQSTGDVLSGLTQNKKLQAVLTTQWGDCGLPPQDSCFLIHALIARHYLNGGYYPIGGASRFAQTMLPQIQSSGGEVFTYARVDEILLSGKRAVGIKMEDGHKIYADTVISAAGVDLTLNRLLPSTKARRIARPEKQKTVQPSMGHFSVYIGLNKSPSDLKLPKTNFWIYLNEQHDKNVHDFMAGKTDNIPLVYISFPSAKDPSWEKRYPNKATIEIVAAAKHEWFRNWENKTWGQRGEDYEAIKQKWQDRLLAILLKKLPQLREHIDYVEIATPLSTQYFCEYRYGEIYGLDHRPERFKQQWLKPQTPIKGLYLTGQDTLTCGVVGAAMSGLLTSVRILGLRKGLTLYNTVQRVNNQSEISEVKQT